MVSAQVRLEAETGRAVAQWGFSEELQDTLYLTNDVLSLRECKSELASYQRSTTVERLVRWRLDYARLSARTITLMTSPTRNSDAPTKNNILRIVAALAIRIQPGCKPASPSSV